MRRRHSRKGEKKDEKEKEEENDEKERRNKRRRRMRGGSKEVEERVKGEKKGLGKEKKEQEEDMYYVNNISYVPVQFGFGRVHCCTWNVNTVDPPLEDDLRPLFNISSKDEADFPDVVAVW